LRLGIARKGEGLGRDRKMHPIIEIVDTGPADKKRRRHFCMTHKNNHTETLKTLDKVCKHLTDKSVSAEDRAAYLAAISGPSSLHDAALTALDELTRQKDSSKQNHSVYDLAWFRVESPSVRMRGVRFKP
jgi:hypothetical protein